MIFNVLKTYLHNLQNDLPLLPERKKNEKVEKLVVNLYDKNEYFIHIRNLKLTLKHEYIYIYIYIYVC